MSDTGTFSLGDWKLQSGEVLKDAVLAWRSWGRLADDHSNMILYATSYGATHDDFEWMIGAGRGLDPDRWFILVPDQFGNGVSTSPSTYSHPARYPHVTIFDNVRAQHRLITELFGVKRLALAAGWSMGGQQAFHWGGLYPQMVARIAPICSSARVSVHNYVFLEGVRACLTTDPNWRGDHFTAKPETGLRAMGRVYAGWALSQAFYRQRLYQSAGYETLEDYLVRSWEENFLRRDANNLLAQLWTWQHADIIGQRRLRRRPRQGARRDRLPGPGDAGRHRPLFHDGGRRHRGGADAECAVEGDSVAVGPPRRQPVAEP